MRSVSFAFAILIQCFLLIVAQDEMRPEGQTPQPERTASPIELATPQPGETIFEVISRTPELSELTNLVEQSGFRLFLDSPYSRVTLFAPTNEAFQMYRERQGEMEPQTGEPQTGEPQTGEPQTGEPQTGEPQTGEPQTGEPQNGEQDQQTQEIQVLAYHIGSPSRTLDSFQDNELFFTAGGLPVRINRYEDIMMVTINGALVQGESSAANGQIIIIDQVLIPPNNTLDEILQQREDFSMFAQLVEQADQEIRDRLSDPSASLTLFVPSNQALEGQDQLQNQEEISNFVRMFISDQVLYSVALYDGRTVETESGQSFQVSIQDNSLLIGDAPLNEVDINAVNGVAHVLNQLPTMGTGMPGTPSDQ